MAIDARPLEEDRVADLPKALEKAGYKLALSPSIRSLRSLIRFENGIRFFLIGSEMLIEQRFRNRMAPDGPNLISVARDIVRLLDVPNINSAKIRSLSLRKSRDPYGIISRELINERALRSIHQHGLISSSVTLQYKIGNGFLSLSFKPHQETRTLKTPHISIRSEFEVRRISNLDFFNELGSIEEVTRERDKIIDSLLPHEEIL